MQNVFTILTTLMMTTAGMSQTLNVQVGSVAYQYPAAQTGAMSDTDATKLTIMGKTFTLSDVDEMKVDDTVVTDNLVTVEYDASSAQVYVAGNVAQYVTPAVDGAHVTIEQSNTDDVDDDEFTYQF